MNNIIYSEKLNEKEIIEINGKKYQLEYLYAMIKNYRYTNIFRLLEIKGELN